MSNINSFKASAMAAFRNRELSRFKKNISGGWRKVGVECMSTNDKSTVD